MGSFEGSQGVYFHSPPSLYPRSLANVASMWGYQVTGTRMALKPASLNILKSAGRVTFCPHIVS